MGRACSRTKSSSSSHIVTSRADPSSWGWKEKWVFQVIECQGGSEGSTFYVFFCSCLTSVTGRCIFFCLGVSFWHYWNTLLVIEGLFDFHICVYEQSIFHLLLYFSISTKVFILNQKSLNLLLWFRTRWHDKNIGSFLPMIMDSEWNCLYQEI